MRHSHAVPLRVRGLQCGEVVLKLLLASLPCGSILGVPIRIHWSALGGLLVLGVTSWLDHSSRPFTWALLRTGRELVLVAALATVVLIHELAHALAAKTCGVRTHGIYMHIFGGLALSLDRTVLKLTPLQEMAILAAGPASNLVACIPAVLLASNLEHRILVRLLAVFVGMNLSMAIFNLLPIWPLDGGQIFRAFLALIRLGSRLSDRITLVFSLLLGVPCAYLAWELDACWIFSILLVLMTVTVLFLGVWGPVPDEPPEAPITQTAAERAALPGLQTAPPLPKTE